MSCITKILELKGDKEVLLPLGGDGKPWVAVEGGGVYKDHEYLIVLNTLGHRCGYVAIPLVHPFSKTPLEVGEFAGRKYQRYDYDSLGIDAHGGLTFMAKDHDLKDLLQSPCDDFWIGFDCGHHLDGSDVEAHKKYYGEDLHKSYEGFFRCMDGEVRTYGYAENVCHDIIDQLIEKAA